MELDDRKISQIVERVIARLGQESSSPEAPRSAAPAIHSKEGGPNIPRGKRGLFQDIDSAVSAAQQAFERFETQGLEVRRSVIQAMRDVTIAHVKELSAYAVAETGLGRYEDKIHKNPNAALKTPGPEILQPRAWTGDYGLAITERAPFGVIGSVTPCTNPTETIINNAISMLSGGNAVVFNVHPNAKRVCGWFVHLLNEAIVGAGGPENLIASIEEPTIESAQALMKSKIRLIAVTGGPAVVKQAMASGKKVIAAGPGNPPVVVDETADLATAAQGIIDGAALDNNIVCIAEKEIIAVADIADRLKQELSKRTALELSQSQIKALEKVVLDSQGHTNKDYVGKNANVIAQQLGIRADDKLRLLICEVDEKHPFVQEELLMPVLPLVRVRDVREGIAMAKRVEHGFGHTAVMYSTNVDAMHEMARVINTSLFVKNGPSHNALALRGEGYCSWTIASPTGEGLTTAINFTRERRCTLRDRFRFV
jgi:acyl-CoA reductase-like NAD-dependent aldehyde dehydrogenase